jgi:sugar phosphate isomerase/epimerase
MTTARTGLMLYSVRRACAEDFEGTLRAVAAMGYTGVELFDLHGHDVAEVRGWLDELGLVVCGLHAPLTAVEDDLPGHAATARALGTDRLVISWVDEPTTAAEAADIERRLGLVAAAAGAQGVRLGFHNHWGELRSFDGEPALLERLLVEMPELFLELDLGWAWYAGADPADLVSRAAGRAPLVHVKDFRRNGSEPSFCPVGDGDVGYETVVPAALAAGVEWLLVEQDQVDGPELDAAERSFAAVGRFAGAAR